MEETSYIFQETQKMTGRIAIEKVQWGDQLPLTPHIRAVVTHKDNYGCRIASRNILLDYNFEPKVYFNGGYFNLCGAIEHLCLEEICTHPHPSVRALAKSITVLKFKEE